MNSYLDNLNKNILIVGGGAVAINFHFPRIQRHFKPSSIYIIENDPLQIKQLTETFKTYKNIFVQNNLPHKDFFLTLIATPPKFHFEYYKKTIEQTKRYIIEKPMTIAAKEAKELEKSSKKNKKKVFVNLLRRSLNNFKLLRELHDKGEFGKLLRVDVAEGGVFGWNAASMGSFSKEFNGGGVLMDTGPHTIDLLFQFFDNLYLKESFMDNDDADTIEANCILNLVDQHNTPITVNLSRNRNLSNTAKFAFDKANCTLDVRNENIHIERPDGIKYTIVSSERKVDFSTLFDNFYENFVVPDKNLAVSPSESIKTIAILEKAYEIRKSIKGAF